MQKVELGCLEVQCLDSLWGAHNRDTRWLSKKSDQQPLHEKLGGIRKHFCGFCEVEEKKDLVKSHNICRLC